MPCNAMQGNVKGKSIQAELVWARITALLVLVFPYEAVVICEGGMSPLVKMREFMSLGAAGGIVLMLAAVLAMLMANSPLAPIYQMLLNFAGRSSHRSTRGCQAPTALD
jgi:hypothetical protein